MPSDSSGRWADKAEFKKFGNISGGPSGGHVSPCAGIDAVGVDRGNEPSHENNRLTYSIPTTFRCFTVGAKLKKV